jgi:hypothetical protein
MPRNFVERCVLCRKGCSDVIGEKGVEASGSPNLHRRLKLTRTSLSRTDTYNICISIRLCLSKIYLTAPSAFSFSISLSFNPKISLKISSVCCPNIGGTLLILGLLSLYFTGVLTILIGPHHSCSISFTMSLANTCSWFNVP